MGEKLCFVADASLMNVSSVNRGVIHGRRGGRGMGVAADGGNAGAGMNERDMGKEPDSHKNK